MSQRINPPHEITMPSALANLPDVHGRFGDYGGHYVPETLVAAVFVRKKSKNIRWRTAMPPPPEPPTMAG
jgi:hypothetical protein